MMSPEDGELERFLARRSKVNAVYARVRAGADDGPPAEVDEAISKSARDAVGASAPAVHTAPPSSSPPGPGSGQPWWRRRLGGRPRGGRRPWIGPVPVSTAAVLVLAASLVLVMENAPVPLTAPPGPTDVDSQLLDMARSRFDAGEHQGYERRLSQGADRSGERRPIRGPETQLPLGRKERDAGAPRDNDASPPTGALSERERLEASPMADTPRAAPTRSAAASPSRAAERLPESIRRASPGSAATASGRKDASRDARTESFPSATQPPTQPAPAPSAAIGASRAPYRSPPAADPGSRTNEEARQAAPSQGATPPARTEPRAGDSAMPRRPSGAGPRGGSRDESEGTFGRGSRTESKAWSQIRLRSPHARVDKRSDPARSEANVGSERKGAVASTDTADFERALVRLRALLDTGRHDEARALAQALLAAHPRRELPEDILGAFDPGVLEPPEVERVEALQ